MTVAPTTINLRRLVLICCILMGSRTAWAAVSPASQAASGPLCGLYSLYAGARLLAKPAPFVDLLTGDYISSHRGSSLRDLYRAATDHGLHAQVASNLTTAALRVARYPIILHVKRSLASTEYDHFLLFIDATGESARIYEPPTSIRRVALHDLAPRWDGTGLILSASPINTAALYAPQRRQFLLYVCLAGIGIWTLRRAVRHWDPFSLATRRSTFIQAILVQAAALPLIGASAGFLWHTLPEEGLLANARMTKAIEYANAAGSIPKVGATQAAELSAGHAVFVDARLIRDFEAGHVPGAINLPVDGSPEDHLQALGGVARGTPIVVYCQSAQCGFARRVASELVAAGYLDVRLFEGGWRTWTKREFPADRVMNHQDRARDSTR
jgi:rhodanese-related sulfurtransferase